jgi:hypothetical protein
MKITNLERISGPGEEHRTARTKADCPSTRGNGTLKPLFENATGMLDDAVKAFSLHNVSPKM